MTLHIESQVFIKFLPPLAKKIQTSNKSRGLSLWFFLMIFLFKFLWLYMLGTDNDLFPKKSFDNSSFVPEFETL